MPQPEVFAHVEKVARDECAKWQSRLGLDHWEIEHTFLDAVRDPDDAGDTTCAECKPQWQYLQAEIVWYLPHLVQCDDDKIDRNSLHEQCHILLAPEQANLKPSESDRMELSTQMTARALWLAWSVDRDRLAA